MRWDRRELAEREFLFHPMQGEEVVLVEYLTEFSRHSQTVYSDLSAD